MRGIPGRSGTTCLHRQWGRLGWQQPTFQEDGLPQAHCTMCVCIVFLRPKFGRRKTIQTHISDFSFSSRNWRFVNKILFLLSKLEKRKSLSLSLLQCGEPFSKFLFLFSKLGKGISGFSFSSRNWRKEYQISLSPLDWTFLPLVNHCCVLWDLPTDQFLQG